MYHSQAAVRRRTFLPAARRRARVSTSLAHPACTSPFCYGEPQPDWHLTPVTAGPDPLPRVVTSITLLPLFHVKTHVAEPPSSQFNISGRPRQRSSPEAHVLAFGKRHGCQP